MSQENSDLQHHSMKRAEFGSALGEDPEEKPKKQKVEESNHHTPTTPNTDAKIEPLNTTKSSKPSMELIPSFLGSPPAVSLSSNTELDSLFEAEAPRSSPPSAIASTDGSNRECFNAASPSTQEETAIPTPTANSKEFSSFESEFISSTCCDGMPDAKLSPPSTIQEERNNGDCGANVLLSRDNRAEGEHAARADEIGCEYQDLCNVRSETEATFTHFTIDVHAKSALDCTSEDLKDLATLGDPAVALDGMVSKQVFNGHPRRDNLHGNVQDTGATDILIDASQAASFTENDGSENRVDDFRFSEDLSSVAISLTSPPDIMLVRADAMEERDNVVGSKVHGDVTSATQAQLLDIPRETEGRPEVTVQSANDVKVGSLDSSVVSSPTNNDGHAENVITTPDEEEIVDEESSSSVHTWTVADAPRELGLGESGQEDHGFRLGVLEDPHHQMDSTTGDFSADDKGSGVPSVENSTIKISQLPSSREPNETGEMKQRKSAQQLEFGGHEDSVIHPQASGALESSNLAASTESITEMCVPAEGSTQTSEGITASASCSSLDGSVVLDPQNSAVSSSIINKNSMTTPNEEGSGINIDQQLDIPPMDIGAFSTGIEETAIASGENSNIKSGHSPFSREMDETDMKQKTSTPKVEFGGPEDSAAHPQLSVTLESTNLAASTNSIIPATEMGTTPREACRENNHFQEITCETSLSLATTSSPDSSVLDPQTSNKDAIPTPTEEGSGINIDQQLEIISVPPMDIGVLSSDNKGSAVASGENSPIKSSQSPESRDWDETGDLKERASAQQVEFGGPEDSAEQPQASVTLESANLAASTNSTIPAEHSTQTGITLSESHHFQGNTFEFPLSPAGSISDGPDLNPESSIVSSSTSMDALATLNEEGSDSNRDQQTLICGPPISSVNTAVAPSALSSPPMNEEDGHSACDALSFANSPSELGEVEKVVPSFIDTELVDAATGENVTIKSSRSPSGRELDDTGDLKETASAQQLEFGGHGDSVEFPPATFLVESASIATDPASTDSIVPAEFSNQASVRGNSHSQDDTCELSVSPASTKNVQEQLTDVSFSASHWLPLAEVACQKPEESAGPKKTSSLHKMTICDDDGPEESSGRYSVAMDCSSLDNDQSTIATEQQGAESESSPPPSEAANASLTKCVGNMTPRGPSADAIAASLAYLRPSSESFLLSAASTSKGTPEAMTESCSSNGGLFPFSCADTNQKTSPVPANTFRSPSPGTLTNTKFSHLIKPFAPPKRSPEPSAEMKSSCAGLRGDGDSEDTCTHLKQPLQKHQADDKSDEPLEETKLGSAKAGHILETGISTQESPPKTEDALPGWCLEQQASSASLSSELSKISDSVIPSTTEGSGIAHDSSIITFGQCCSSPPAANDGNCWSGTRSAPTEYGTPKTLSRDQDTKKGSSANTTLTLAQHHQELDEQARQLRKTFEVELRRERVQVADAMMQRAEEVVAAERRSMAKEIAKQKEDIVREATKEYQDQWQELQSTLTASRTSAVNARVSSIRDDWSRRQLSMATIAAEHKENVEVQALLLALQTQWSKECNSLLKDREQAVIDHYNKELKNIRQEIRNEIEAEREIYAQRAVTLASLEWDRTYLNKQSENGKY